MLDRASGGALTKSLLDSLSLCGQADTLGPLLKCCGSHGENHGEDDDVDRLSGLGFGTQVSARAGS